MLDADVLAMQGTRASTAMLLAHFFFNLHLNESKKYNKIPSADTKWSVGFNQ